MSLKGSGFVSQLGNALTNAVSPISHEKKIRTNSAKKVGAGKVCDAIGELSSTRAVGRPMGP